MARSSAAFALLAVACVACVALASAAVIPSTGYSGSASVNYTQANGNSPAGSADVPQTVLARSVTGVTPDQIKIIYWGNNSYLLSWATGDGQVGPPGILAPPTGGLQSTAFVSTNPNASFVNGTDVLNFTGISLTYEFDYSKDVETGYLDYDYSHDPGQVFLPVNYISPILHHVLVQGLQPSTTYYYRVGDPRYWQGLSQVLSFTTLADVSAPVYPFRLGVVADVGQTYNTTSMLQRLMTEKIDALALIGDFTYADNFNMAGCQYYSYYGVAGHNAGSLCPFSRPEGDVGEQTYQPKWDAWGRLWEPLLNHVPFLFANGNHEIEELPNSARFTAVNARYPMPPANGLYSSAIDQSTYLNTFVQGQFADSEFDPEGAYKNMFYAVEVPGATIIYLTTFIGGDNFSPDSVQYKWFEKTLQAVDRTRTPWLIVNFHYPMYSSYAGTYKGIDCFRQTFEPLMYKYSVDVVLNGHVHAYERTNPVYNYTLNQCGAVHITVGDGGNNEGVSKTFFDTGAATRNYCQPGAYTKRKFPEYQPQACFTMNADGSYCDFTQPAWSAYRNPSWGYGVLTLLNATTAHWMWNNTDNGSMVFDEVYFTRNPNCTNSA